MRFLQTSDWQWGMTRHWLDADDQARFTQARNDAVVRAGAVAAEHDCAFMVVAGDVFDSNHLRRETVRRAMEALRQVPVPVYLLPGNHDALNAASVYDSTAFTEAGLDHVHVLRDSEPVEVAPGVELVGVPLSTNQPDHDVVAAALDELEPPDEGVRRVLVAHGQLAELDPGRRVSALDGDRIRQALDAGLVHWVALGDRHSRWVDSSGLVHYSGAVEVTDFRDSDVGDVLVVDLADEGASPSAEVVHVGTWRMLEVREEVNSAEDVARLREQWQAVEDKSTVLLRHALTGTLSLTDDAALQELLEWAEDTFAAAFAWDRHTDVVVVPDDAELSDIGIGGYVAQAAADLKEQSEGGGEGAAAASDALRLLHRYATAGERA
ncbi:exonuclease SbcCD subunit D [Kytococcus sedentarius]|uniref:metallophosphoesterase family protein n=1 Tax=Kytococcus sedentarius TaxID=1276 RepID=UPI0035BC61BF